MILKVADALKSLSRTYPNNAVRRDQNKRKLTYPDNAVRRDLRKVNVLDFNSRRLILLKLLKDVLSS